MHNRLNDEISSDGTSSDESKKETSDISSSAPVSTRYGSTPIQEKSVGRFHHVPLCGLTFYVMTFFGFFCSFALRESLSVAIVAMVNQTTVTELDFAVTVSECPRDPELERESGEFSWDRNQEAIVLSAFYYGYVVTEVRLSLRSRQSANHGF